MSVALHHQSVQVIRTVGRPAWNEKTKCIRVFFLGGGGKGSNLSPLKMALPAPPEEGHDWYNT